MGLEQLNFDGKNKVEVAIDRIKHYEPPEGYYLAFSGGKDSVVIYDLATKAQVKFDAHYNVSPIDPLEIYSFIRRHYSSISWDKTASGFWRRFMIEGPPMRHMRWCCELIKEAGGTGRIKIVGTRRQESSNRKGYTEFDPSYKYAHTYFLQPIVDWTKAEVWEYLYQNHLPYCDLYDEGASGSYKGDGYYPRLGCVLCPFESPAITQRNLARFSKIATNWYRAFERYYQVRIERGTPLSFETVTEYWQWWISRK